MKTRFKQHGMAVLSMIFIAIAMVGVLAAYLAYSKPSNVSTGQKSSELMSSSLIDQGNAIRDGFALMLSKGTSANSIYNSTLNGTIADATPGAAGNTIKAGAGANNANWMYDPTNGGTSRQDVMPDAMANSTTNRAGWVIKTTADDATASGAPVVKLKGVGADANEDFVALAYDIKLGVCQAVNKSVNGALITDNPPVSTGIALAAWQTPGAAVDLSAGFSTGAGIANINGQNQGCFATSDGKYVYFTVLQAN
jgi:hypothetical protein